MIAGKKTSASGISKSMTQSGSTDGSWGPSRPWICAPPRSWGSTESSDLCPIPSCQVPSCSTIRTRVTGESADHPACCEFSAPTGRRCCRCPQGPPPGQQELLATRGCAEIHLRRKTWRGPDRPGVLRLDEQWRVRRNAPGPRTTGAKDSRSRGSRMQVLVC